MKQYEVMNPYIVFSVKDGEKRTQYALKKGETAKLPENDITVRALLARRQIKEAETAPTAPAGGKK